MPPRSEESKDAQRKTIARRAALLKPFKDAMKADERAGDKEVAESFKEERRELNERARKARDKKRKDNKAKWAPKLLEARAKIGIDLNPEGAWQALLKQERKASEPQIEARARKKLEALKLKANGGSVDGGPVEHDEDDEGEDEDVPEDEDEAESVAAQ